MRGTSLFAVCALSACAPLAVAPATSTRFADAPTELEVQALAMAMADDYRAALGEATYLAVGRDDLAPRARWLALSFLRNGMGAAIDIASGPNPDIALSGRRRAA